MNKKKTTKRAKTTISNDEAMKLINHVSMLTHILGSELDEYSGPQKDQDGFYFSWYFPHETIVTLKTDKKELWVLDMSSKDLSTVVYYALAGFCSSHGYKMIDGYTKREDNE
jgi:hypothetical protein